MDRENSPVRKEFWDDFDESGGNISYSPERRETNPGNNLKNLENLDCQNPEVTCDVVDMMKKVYVSTYLPYVGTFRDTTGKIRDIALSTSSDAESVNLLNFDNGIVSSKTNRPLRQNKDLDKAFTEYVSDLKKNPEEAAKNIFVFVDDKPSLDGEITIIFRKPRRGKTSYMKTLPKGSDTKEDNYRSGSMDISLVFSIPQDRREQFIQLLQEHPEIALDIFKFFLPSNYIKEQTPNHTYPDSAFFDPDYHTGKGKLQPMNHAQTGQHYLKPYPEDHIANRIIREQPTQQVTYVSSEALTSDPIYHKLKIDVKKIITIPIPLGHIFNG